jgi:hypothetical protein
MRGPASSRKARCSGPREARARRRRRRRADAARAVDADSAENKRRLFFQTFFGALAPCRSAVAFVNIIEPHNPSSAGCAAHEASQGGAAARSLGLFGLGEASKPASLEVRGAAATFASP